MAGWLDKLKTLGSAHLRHVAAIRAALQESNVIAAREGLAAYLQGLSGPALAGFRISAGIVAAAERDPAVGESLRWILANVDALRFGELAAITPASLPAHGARLQQVTALLASWAPLSEEEGERQFEATLNALDARGQEEFAVHLETLAAQQEARLEQMRSEEPNAWGSTLEDRIAYLQASISTGRRDPGHTHAITEQQQAIAALKQMADTARYWRTAKPEAQPQLNEIDLTNFPHGGSAAEMTAFMRATLEQLKARGNMDPARIAALEDTLDGNLSDARQHEARKRARRGDSGDRTAQKAELQADMLYAGRMIERTQRVLAMQSDVRLLDDSPPGTRAAKVRRHVNALVEDAGKLVLGAIVARREAEQSQAAALQAQLVQARGRVSRMPDEEGVLRYETDMLRPTAHALRLFHRRGHLMIARPIWPCGDTQVDPSSVVFVGPEALRASVAQVCVARRLELLLPHKAGFDQASWSWRCMQRAGIAIIDVTDDDPQTYYQLGQTYALGTELLLAAREGVCLPFDVAQFVHSWNSVDDFADQLPAALDATLYGVQTEGLRALMHATLERCQRLAEEAVGLKHATELLAQLEATVQSPIEFRAAVEQFLGLLGNSRLMLLHPRWPAYYPPSEGRRCFVVMPFAMSLEDTQAMYGLLGEDLSAAGVEVIRGDQASGQEIVASIWEETARASHVIVDLTGFNLNVCLELGMADSIGRDTLLIGARGTVETRFASIAKRRIYQYGADDASRDAVRAKALAFTRQRSALQ